MEFCFEVDEVLRGHAFASRLQKMEVSLEGRDGAESAGQVWRPHWLGV